MKYNSLFYYIKNMKYLHIFRGLPLGCPGRKNRKIGITFEDMDRFLSFFVHMLKSPTLVE